MLELEKKHAKIIVDNSIKVVELEGISSLNINEDVKEMRSED